MIRFAAFFSAILLSLTLGAGATILDPTVPAPPAVFMTTAGFDASQYTLGTMTLTVEPTDEPFTLVSSQNGSGRFQDVGHGGVCYGVHEGKRYAFLVSYATSAPPESLFTVRLKRTFGLADRFDAKLNLGNGTVAIQPDGRLIVTGLFTMVDGQPRVGIVRLNSDGSVDETFSPVMDGYATCASIQPDGKILLAGYFDVVNGDDFPGLARLNPDGSLDPTFQPAINDQPERLVLLEDGKVLVVGHFTTTGEHVRRSVARLNEDGSVDANFDAGLVAETLIYGVAVQADGKILLGGPLEFPSETRGLTRLDENGALDPTFVGMTVGVATAIAVQGDGKIVIGGHFSSVNGQTRTKIARLEADGTLDAGFSTGNAVGPVDRAVSGIALQADGRIILTGTFQTVGGVNRFAAVARLESDGELDMSFAPLGSSERISGLALDKEGSLFVNGFFGSMGGAARNGLAKLLNGPGVSEISTNGDDVSWLRDGAVPDLASVRFEASSDGGATWDFLGDGIRSGNTWILENADLPEDGFVRGLGCALVSNRGFGIMRSTAVFGRTLTALENWRDENFGEPTNEGDGQDQADPEGDGLQNLIEFGFGLDPWTASAGVIPEWQGVSDGQVVEFVPPSQAAGLQFAAEWSRSMRSDDWFPAIDQSIGEVKRFKVLADDEPKMFMRLKVTNP